MQVKAAMAIVDRVANKKRHPRVEDTVSLACQISKGSDVLRHFAATGQEAETAQC